MPQITIHRNKESYTQEFERGLSLLSILQGQEENIHAPCGGNSTCGKCRVKIKGVGYVTSCIYYPESDLEVIIPQLGETKVLTAQHDFSLNLPFDPGAAVCLSETPYGLAIDIGTTSIALYLIDLQNGHSLGTQGIANSQGKLGADVISRINHCANEGGLLELQKLVINDIMNAITALCLSFQIEPRSIVKMSVSANTTMLHLLLGVDPTSIALAPFTPNFIEEKWVLANEIGFNNLHPELRIHILPSISAYIGADIVSGIASLKPSEVVKKYLFIDVGTNGEMALVTEDKIWCTATAAGPALEGANISCGMGAYPGAISVFNADEILSINDEKPIGLCGSGLIDALAYMLDNEIIGMDGLLSEDFILTKAEDAGSGEDVKLVAQDIREVQLAKSAIFTGIQALIALAETSYEDIDALFLAGGLGNYLNIESAIRIGLLPAEMKDKIIQVGNTSGTGAVLDVTSEIFIDKMKTVVAKSEHLDLSSDPNFEMNFAMNMFF